LVIAVGACYLEDLAVDPSVGSLRGLRLGDSAHAGDQDRANT
jgi:hypothetical protein